MLNIRPVSEADKSSWAPLWDGYLEFYRTQLPQAQSDLTWQRLIDPDFNLYGLVAQRDGKLQGLTHYSFQISSWAPKNFCYLEDLFVDPQVRCGGIGRALIDGVRDVALSSGSSRLYWNTDATNSTARKLYDSYISESGKVQYRIQFASDYEEDM
jgi:GNAT superfamily N-acetyltransferase